jgi:hypothetical protein
MTLPTACSVAALQGVCEDQPTIILEFNILRKLPPLPFAVKLTYGAGELAAAVPASLSAFFILYFLTAVAGLPPVLAGSVLLIGRLWDAVNDPLVGWLSDRTRSPLGRRFPWMLGGSNCPWRFAQHCCGWCPRSPASGGCSPITWCCRCSPWPPLPLCNCPTRPWPPNCQTITTNAPRCMA